MLPAVTALGGGHGLFTSLQALRRVTDRLTAVVTVADDGGSSGRLRRELGGIPPGDLRMALAALCGDDTTGRTWASILQSRFDSNGPLDGHAIGNLLIEGVWQSHGTVPGLDMVGQLLHARGRVLPMSLVPLTIEADVVGVDPVTPDESIIIAGQHAVAVSQGLVTGIRLVPSHPIACAEAIESVMTSDYIVLGPGSWFTSVLPHLLVPELAEAIITSPGRRVLTMNVDASHETAGVSPSRHLEILADHAPGLRLDAIIADASFAAGDPILARYAQMLGAELLVTAVRHRDGSARHDPLRLAAVYDDLIVGAS